MRASTFTLLVASSLMAAGAATLEEDFRDPPDSARPGVYWYFMDGNLDRDEMTRDLDSMKEAGLGHVVWLEVNADVPRGPVDMLSPEWLEIFAHGVRHAKKIGIDVTLGAGPGWTGSGGPWIKPEESMQHLVFSETAVKGPASFRKKLPVAPQRDHWWKMLDVDFYEDVAVYAFPACKPTIEDAEQKAFYVRPGYMPGHSPAFLPAPARHAATPEGEVVDPATVIDLSDRLKPDGTLEWEVPPGEWTVLRFGRRSNGTSNRPASHPVVGLDHDKFSKELLEKHFDHYFGKLFDAVGKPEPGTKGGIQAIHLDSWEMNAQNWTPGLLDEFRKRRGYDFTPWLPSFSGRVVGDRATSERALWDLRLTIQELMLENYAGHLRTLAHDHGLKFSIEPYEMTQTADLELGALADVPMCEFWSTKYDCSHSAIEAASVAHTLGKPVVSSESFTGHRDERGRHYPGSLKNQADWALAIGVNHFQFHTFTHKPLGEEARPGMTMGEWGIRWDRGQSWWPMVGGFHRYLARCSQLLQQGTTVSDILYLTPEGAPHVFSPPPSALAGSGVLPDKKGYSFDGCSPGIVEKMSVTDGFVGTREGSSYRLLVLPRFSTMTPGFLKTIIRLVEDGATVVGHPPSASPSLVGYPGCDDEVKQLAETLWGEPPYAAERKFGKGRVILDAGAAEFLARNPEPPTKEGGESIYPDHAVTAQLLDAMGVPEDFRSDAPLRFTHRRTDEAEIYFVSNPSDEAVATTATFRVKDGIPHRWDPVTGDVRELPRFDRVDDTTRVPLAFASHESFFVVFARDESSGGEAREPEPNFPGTSTIAEIEGPWRLSFDPKRGGPGEVTFDQLQDWTTRKERGIKYYSGIATYRKTFQLSEETITRDRESGRRMYLELGTVHDLARVRINGKGLGVVWCAPWQVEITDAVQAGVNQLEIEIANRWSNRQLGDQEAPDKDARTLRWESGLLGGKEHKAGRYTFSTGKDLGELLPSGLLGPVTLSVDAGHGFTWKSETPDDCPFEPSPSLTGIHFTGRHGDYQVGDTFYPSWASDGNLYSPWTDGHTDGVRCSSGGNLTMGFRTGQAIMTGDDPMSLVIRNTSPPKQALATPYRGRYPCGSLVHDGIWYYGTYCLGPSASYGHEGFRWNWPNLGPMPGFHISRDLGKTWEDPPTSPVEPLFPEPGEFLGPVKMGAPHFVDFGRNMEHSPDGKAYLLGMGAEVNDLKPRPCIKPGPEGTVFELNGECGSRVHFQLRRDEAANEELKPIYEKAFKEVDGKPFAHGNLSWITADQVYLARVTPSPETINDLEAYEFFAGHDERGEPLWTDDFSKIKPLIEWNNHMGCVTATWVPGLKKYLMCVTDGWPTVAKMNSYILEADTITGPWRMVTYMKDFGEQAYFLNFPSKFISEDGRTLWLCYSANFSSGWNGVDLKFNPPGGRYGMSLHEVKLIGGPEGTGN